jgi:hypothetical protein
MYLISRKHPRSTYLTNTFLNTPYIAVIGAACFSQINTEATSALGFSQSRCHEQRFCHMYNNGANLQQQSQRPLHGSADGTGIAWIR